jgi:phosphate starvation-inducible protein PhoH
MTKKATTTTKVPALKPTSRPKKAETTTTQEVKKNIDLLSQIKIDLKHKNEIQKKLTLAIKNGDVTICTGPAGTGKAQTLDSLILTPNGYVRMGDITVGNEVIGVDGLPIKVNGVYPQGEKEIYEISFSDGTKTECCGEHLWLTQTYEERNYKKRVRGNDGTRIRIGNKGIEGKVRDTLEIMNTLTVGDKSKKVNHSIPIVKPIVFDKKETSIDPYLLGCLLGDGGFTTTSLSFTSNDTELVNELTKRLPENHLIKKRYSQNYVIKSIGVKENKITSYLKNIKLFGLKSDDKFIPNEFLINDINTRLEILRGLLDTDGSVDKKSGTPIFYSTSNELINGVTFIVQSLGGVVKKTEKIGKYKKLNGEIKECKTIYTLYINLPNEFIPFKLNRKIELLKLRTKYTPIRFIKEIKVIGNKEAQCISVNDEKHLYLTNDCIVTHNTLLSVAEALILLKAYPDKYQEIKLVKSIVQLKDEDLGTLPGDEKDKLKFIMMSFFDAFYKLIGEELTNKLLEAGYIKMEVFGSIRGRSIANCIILFDEFQNVTDNNGKTLLTRFSENTKVIALGDSNQVDLKNPETSCLSELVRMAKLIPEEGVNVVEFTEAEVVRHRLTKYFIQIFEHKDYKKKTDSKNLTSKKQKEKTFFQKFLNLFK